MATLPFKKIRLSITRDAVEKALEATQKLGVVEFSEVAYEDLTREDQQSFDANYQANQLDFAISFLSEYEDKNVIAKILEGTAVYTTEDNILETVDTFPYKKMIDDVHDLESSLNDTNAKLEELSKEETIYGNWTGLDIDLTESFTTKTTQTLPVRVREAKREAFETALNEYTSLHHLTHVEDESYLLTFLKEDEQRITELVNRFQVVVISLPKREGTPAEILNSIADQRIELEEKQLELEKEARDLTENLPNLRKVADYFHWKKDQEKTRYENGRASTAVYVFEGWCPEQYVDELYHQLDQITHTFHLETIDPTDENDIPPVALENMKAVWPFESVTRLYGVPTHRDIDPTPFLSGFFFLFFGLCLTDVGYGLFLVVLTGLALLLYRVQRAMKQLFILLLLGGVSSMIVGLFFGGYFGVDISMMPQWLQNLQYFDPINEPLPFFYLTLIVGFVQVSIGLILDIVRQMKHETLTSGLLDNGPWLLLFLGLVLWIGGTVGIIPALGFYLWIMGLAVGLLVLTQGRREKNIVMKGVKGVLGLYGFVNYFSDILSYSRLLALGLATSALAFSINLIAALLNDMMPGVIAPIAMAIVLAIGHTFNLVVNVLGAYIHTARLQFIEFFGKFLVGTGRSFAPFKRDERHVVLEE